MFSYYRGVVTAGKASIRAAHTHTHTYLGTHLYARGGSYAMYSHVVYDVCVCVCVCRCDVSREVMGEYMTCVCVCVCVRVCVQV